MNENDLTLPELGPLEVICPECRLSFHGPLGACPSCAEMTSHA